MHYLTGRFETDYGGQLWNPTRAGVPTASKLLVCSEYLANTDLDRFGEPGQVIGCSTWADVLKHLEAEYPREAGVAVFPCAAIQCPADAVAWRSTRLTPDPLSLDQIEPCHQQEHSGYSIRAQCDNGNVQKTKVINHS